MSIFKKIFGKKIWEEIAEDEWDTGAAMAAAWEVPATRSVVGETVIDTIGVDDTSMPEELRGCQVVERRFSDGTSEVFYVGDGIHADESQVAILIEAHRASVSKSPGHQPPRVGAGGFAPAPVAGAGSVRLSQVMNAGSPQPGAGPQAGVATLPTHTAPPGPSGSVPATNIARGTAPSVSAGALNIRPGVPSALPVSPQAPVHAAQSTGPQAGAGTGVPQASGAVSSSASGDSAATAGVTPSSGTSAAGFDVLDELPDDETVPKALRAALVVRKTDGVYYLTKDARFVPKEEAEEWLDLWERAHNPAARASSGPPPRKSKLPVEPADQAEVRFAEVTPSKPHRPLPPDAFGSDSSPGMSPEVTPRVLESPLKAAGPGGQDGRPRAAPRLELEGRPVIKGWGFQDAGPEQDPWAKALEQAGLTAEEQASQAFGGDLGDALPTIPQARPDRLAEAESQPAGQPPVVPQPQREAPKVSDVSGARVSVGRSETPTDKLKPSPELLAANQETSPESLGPAFRKVLRLAEALRQDTLAGNWAPELDLASEDVVRQLCEEEIGKPWSDDRVERMVVDSAVGYSALMASTGGLDRVLRRELESGGKVVIVANPARVADLDMSLVATLARLRSVGAKRAVVVRDLARLFAQVTCADLGNYLMTRSFVEEFSLRLGEDPEAARGKTIKVSALRRLMSDLLSRRAAISLNDIVEQVERRHAVTLEFLKPVLMEALEPVFKSVSDELILRLKGRKSKS